MNEEKEELAKISNLTGRKGHLDEIMEGADVFVGVSVGVLVGVSVGVLVGVSVGVGDGITSQSPSK